MKGFFKSIEGWPIWGNILTIYVGGGGGIIRMGCVLQFNWGGS